jgi:hypothetical protein
MTPPWRRALQKAGMRRSPVRKERECKTRPDLSLGSGGMTVLDCQDILRIVAVGQRLFCNGGNELRFQ